MRELMFLALFLCLAGTAGVTVAAGLRIVEDIRQAEIEAAYLAAIGQSGPHSEDWSGMRE